MHIEPGYVASAKILAANLAAAALLGSQSIHLLKAPQLVVRSLIAGVLFLLFMQAFHLPVARPSCTSRRDAAYLAPSVSCRRCSASPSACSPRAAVRPGRPLFTSA